MEGDEKPNLNETPEIDDILHSSSSKGLCCNIRTQRCW